MRTFLVLNFSKIQFKRLYLHIKIKYKTLLY
uniref:Uncharacterized protein n=1 Tax=viral metagenome TaxID=1070528 RepID=A0A6C0BCQ6_9ZZZZ